MTIYAWVDCRCVDYRDYNKLTETARNELIGCPLVDTSESDAIWRYGWLKPNNRDDAVYWEMESVSFLPAEFRTNLLLLGVT